MLLTRGRLENGGGGMSRRVASGRCWSMFARWFAEDKIAILSVPINGFG
jgi:hypothetical protein